MVACQPTTVSVSPCDTGPTTTVNPRGREALEVAMDKYQLLFCNAGNLSLPSGHLFSLALMILSVHLNPSALPLPHALVVLLTNGQIVYREKLDYSSAARAVHV